MATRSLHVGDESDNILRVISHSASLEDGEITECHFSDSQQHANDQHMLHAVNQDRTSMPPSLRPPFEPMTEQDLDRAKSLVLDLLGWGVTPEYLVECGLSPGAVYKIFTDLRLRLPQNVDMSLSLPSTPEHDGR